jgi:hypothetical protein
MTTLTIQLPQSLLQQVDDFVLHHGTTVDALIEALLERHMTEFRSAQQSPNQQNRPTEENYNYAHKDVWIELEEN